MLAKLTSKNQITLPKLVIQRFAGADYFEVSTDGVSIRLRPLKRSRADEVRDKLAAMGIRNSDVKDAVRWSRRK
jgi:hypothetical protein